MLPELRRIIALWAITGLPVKKMARLSGVTPGEFLYLNRALQSDYAFTQHSAVRFCIEHGLPASAWVELPLMDGNGARERKGRVRNAFGTNSDVLAQNAMSAVNRMWVECPICEQRVHGLPCVQCHRGPDDDPDAMEAMQEQPNPPLLVPEPTDAKPGSKKKFEILRLRAERGEMLWHPDDNKHPILKREIGIGRHEFSLESVSCTDSDAVTEDTEDFTPATRQRRGLYCG